MNELKFKNEIDASVKLLSESSGLNKEQLERNKFSILSKIYNLPKEEPKSFYWQEKKERVVRQIVSVLLGLSLLGGSAFASESSLPGDKLYPLKLLSEKVKLGLALTSEYKEALKQRFAEERVSEQQKLHKDDPAPKSVNQNNLVELNVKTEGQAGIDFKGTIQGGPRTNNVGLQGSLKQLQEVELGSKTQGQAESQLQSGAVENINGNLKLDIKLK